MLQLRGGATALVSSQLRPVQYKDKEQTSSYQLLESPEARSTFKMSGGKVSERLNQDETHCVLYLQY